MKTIYIVAHDFFYQETILGAQTKPDLWQTYLSIVP